MVAHAYTHTHTRTQFYPWIRTRTTKTTSHQSELPLRVGLQAMSSAPSLRPTYYSGPGVPTIRARMSKRRRLDRLGILRQRRRSKRERIDGASAEACQRDVMPQGGGGPPPTHFSDVRTASDPINILNAVEADVLDCTRRSPRRNYPRSSRKW